MRGVCRQQVAAINRLRLDVFFLCNVSLFLVFCWPYTTNRGRCMLYHGTRMPRRSTVTLKTTFCYYSSKTEKA